MYNQTKKVIHAKFVCDDDRCNIIDCNKSNLLSDRYHYIGKYAINLIKRDMMFGDDKFRDTLYKQHTYTRTFVRTKAMYDFIRYAYPDVNPISYLEIPESELYNDHHPEVIDIYYINIDFVQLLGGYLKIDNVNLSVQPFVRVVSEYNIDCVSNNQVGYTIPSYGFEKSLIRESQSNLITGGPLI